MIGNAWMAPFKIQKDLHTKMSLGNSGQIRPDVVGSTPFVQICLSVKIN